MPLGSIQGKTWAKLVSVVHGLRPWVQFHALPEGGRKVWEGKPRSGQIKGSFLDTHVQLCQRINTSSSTWNPYSGTMVRLVPWSRKAQSPESTYSMSSLHLLVGACVCVFVCVRAHITGPYICARAIAPAWRSEDSLCVACACTRMHTCYSTRVAVKGSLSRAVSLLSPSESLGLNLGIMKFCGKPLSSESSHWPH